MRNRIPFLTLVISALLFVGCDSSLTSIDETATSRQDGKVVGGPSNAGGPSTGVKGGCDLTVPEDHATIQDAVDAADPDARVCVNDGTYREQVVIDKNLTLQGIDEPTIISPAAPSSFVIPESAGSNWEPIVFAYGGTVDGSGNISGSGTIEVDIAGFVVDGDDRTPNGRAVGVFYRNAAGTIADNTVRNMLVNGRETFGILAYGDSDVSIASNHVSGYGRGGIGANGNGGVHPSPTAVIEGNTVVGPGRHEDVTWGPNGIQLGFGAAGRIDDNHVSENGWPGPEWSGSGIIVFESDDVQVRGNTLAENESAVSIGTWGWFRPSANSIKVVKNTIDGADSGISMESVAWQFSTMDAQMNNVKVVNNVIRADNGEIGIALGVTNASSDFTATADNNKLVNNKIQGFDTPVADEGSDSKVQANRDQLVFGP